MDTLEEGLADFFYKQPDSESFRQCGPRSKSEDIM